MEYTFEELQPEHLEEFRRLFKSAFGHSPESSYFRDKYANTLNYCGAGWFGYLARYNGKMVAFTGAVPLWMTYQGKTELGAHSLDAFTDKKHRGHELNSRLMAMLIARMKNEGIRFTWGLPNQLLEPVLLKKSNYAWKVQFKGYVLHDSESFRKKIQRKAGFRINWKLKGVIEGMRTDEPFYGSIDPQEFVCVQSDSAYFSYKEFTGNCVIRYKNALLWVKVDTDLLIGDVQATDDADIREALTGISELAANIGVRYVLYQGIQGTRVAQIASSLAVRTFDSWRLCYRDMGSEFPLEKLRIRYGDLDTF